MPENNKRRVNYNTMYIQYVPAQSSKGNFKLFGDILGLKYR